MSTKEDQIADLRKQIEILQLQQQYNQMQAGQQQPSAGSNGGVPTTIHKKHVRLDATAVKGSVVGQATGTLKATLRDTDGEAVQDEEVVFLLTSSRQEMGRQFTNSLGVAELSAGSNIGDPQLWIEALGSGFTAMYSGSKEYYPAEAKAITRASLF